MCQLAVVWQVKATTQSQSNIKTMNGDYRDWALDSAAVCVFIY